MHSEIESHMATNPNNQKGMKPELEQTEEPENDNEIRLKDDGCMQLVLKLLARLADGQYRELQV